METRRKFHRSNRIKERICVAKWKKTTLTQSHRKKEKSRSSCFFTDGWYKKEKARHYQKDIGDEDEDKGKNVKLKELMDLQNEVA